LAPNREPMNSNFLSLSFRIQRGNPRYLNRKSKRDRNILGNTDPRTENNQRTARERRERETRADKNQEAREGSVGNGSFRSVKARNWKRPARERRRRDESPKP
jgi:hypothetical protein